MLKSYEKNHITEPTVSPVIFQIKLTMARTSMHISKSKTFLTSCLRYPKHIANLAECFGHARPNPSKNIVSIAENFDLCQHAKNQFHHSFLS